MEQLLQGHYRAVHCQVTGQWNGLVRALMDKKADMVMTSLKITPERSEMIDFSIPFIETGITILVAVRDGVISPTAFLGASPWQPDCNLLKPMRAIAVLLRVCEGW